MGTSCTIGLVMRMALLIAIFMPVKESSAWGARSQVKAILGSSDLADAALYLDTHKSTLEKKIKDWHYDDRPTCESNVPRSKYCPGGNCASVQLKRHYNILRVPQSSIEQKRFAIRVVAHLAGDIHQPMHAADHDDAGGNAIKLTGTWNASANLHSVWDSDFVKRAFSGNDFKGKSDRQIAALLVQQISDSEKDIWTKGRVVTWLQESYGKAVDHAYGALPGFGCNEKDFATEPITLTDAYIGKSIESVPEQLKKGGVRLAAILNRALSTDVDAAKAFVRADKL